MPIPVYYSEVYVKDGDTYHGALAIRGPQGAQGEQGEQGLQGPPGEGLQIDYVVSGGTTAAAIEAEYPAADNEGKVALGLRQTPAITQRGGMYWRSNGTTWVFLGNVSGPPGDTPIFDEWPSSVIMEDNTPGTPSASVSLFNHVNPLYPDLTPNYSFAFVFHHLKGEKGDTGAKGDTGNTGPQGPKGDPFTYADFTVEQLEALRGPQGIQGVKGDKGDPGTGIGTFYYTPIVLISNTEPQNPVDNLLYVQNDSNVDTGFVHVGYTTDKPTFNPDGSNLEAGDVYIMQGDINQHPLLWGNIKVYPIRVWVYDGSQWVAKNAKSYVNNQWYPLNSVWLIDRGVFVTDYTNYGGKITTGTNSVEISVATNYLDFYFTFGQPITGNIKIHIEGTLNIYDVQSHSEIIGFASNYPTTGPSDFSGTTLTENRYNNFVTPELSLNNSVVGFTFNYICNLEIRNLWYEIL